MDEKKKFAKQILNSDDYGKTEKGAKVLKDIGKIVPVVTAAVVTIIKRGPDIIKNLKGIIK